MDWRWPVERGETAQNFLSLFIIPPQTRIYMSFIYHVSFLCEIFDIGHLPLPPLLSGFDTPVCVPPLGKRSLYLILIFIFYFLRNIPPFVSTNTFIFTFPYLVCIFFYVIVTNLNENELIFLSSTLIPVPVRSPLPLRATEKCSSPSPLSIGHSFIMFRVFLLHIALSDFLMGWVGWPGFPHEPTLASLPFSFLVVMIQLMD
jgi:hypothetical protein